MDVSKSASDRPVKYPGIPLTTNGNQLVAYYTEARITDAGVFYPITPSTEMGENYQLAFAEGKLNVFGRPKLAIETEGEHAAQGGAIAISVTGKRVVNFTSGQGLVYGLEQYYHAPGKLSTMVVEVAARALTKHALNVHCGHDDIYAALDTGWIILFAKDAQQAADQALILRRVTELSLTPGINVQDGFLTSHLERSFKRHEAELLREFLGAPEDTIDTPTPAQRELFGPRRRRVPALIDLANPALIGPVQNQEHYMNGVVARRNNFAEPILGFLADAYAEFGRLTGRDWGFISRYRCEDADTVFVSLGSAAENIEAAVDHLRATRGAKVGSLHVNVLRPFPEAALVEALAGVPRVIVLERTDEALAGANPLTRDLRAAFTKALENGVAPAHAELPAIGADRLPRIFSGVYGLGSRDFRPEHVLGAWEFAAAGGARTDGRTAASGESFFLLGVDHPYAVCSIEKPSLLPDHAIAVRMHSIGGWGMITMGKNLGEILGEFGRYLGERDAATGERLHVSANPKYGSEKKGAPTNYFLVVAPERIRVNCDLHHVDVVLCCDPKAFLHTNPLEGLNPGGAFVWESDETPETAWTRIPPRYRQQILDDKIRVFILPGFQIARAATDRSDLQLRMQGNAFLGAFFGVSSFLADNGIDREHYQEVVRAQYVKKFGRFGDAVVASNMTVMEAGFAQVREIVYGTAELADRSNMRGQLLVECVDGGCSAGALPPAGQGERARLFTLDAFDGEFRAGLGYDQPASAFASVGIMAAATGATASKTVARRETPIWIPENCTQCMECIAACPDTALPNTAQDLATVLRTAIINYVAEPVSRAALLKAVPALDAALHPRMLAAVQAKEHPTVHALVAEELGKLEGVSAEARAQLIAVLEQVPLAYNKVNAIFLTKEKKEAGAGGVFAIFVSDLCKGCAECVTECGDHQALVMAPETEDLNSHHLTGTAFMNLLPDTSRKYLGLYDDEHPLDSKTAALRNHLMQRRNYQALVSGDGACAGCGEKSVLHAVASLTEALMRPLYHAKAERLSAKAARLRAHGAERLAALAGPDAEGAQRWRQAVVQILMGLGGESEEDSLSRLAARPALADAALVEAVAAVLEQDAFNHKELQALDGRLANGMSVMAMGAHTGCNTVYGSTPPNNPHPYPWMNSLFQDGATVTWLFGESFIMDHARRSVVPERLADILLADSGKGEGAGHLPSAAELFALAHLTDAGMSEREIAELPKAWGIGGDGGMGDIGFQNVSKVVLQNRPNVKLLMLDTQVYSNTGGQNSDSSPAPGGFDMNQFGEATQGKDVEKKSLAEIFTAGHGSPYVAQVSMANAPRLYQAILDALAYRGTAFIQCFTTCQPEHGVADDAATRQAQRIRDSRGMPEFVFDPRGGETYAEALDLKGNPTPEADWWEARSRDKQSKYRYTVAHWATTEARFRRHFKRLKPGEAAKLVPLEAMLLRISQQDVVARRYRDPAHRAYVPDFGVFIRAEDEAGAWQELAMSRQMVLFCVERRKAWRMLQSKAGIVNREYRAQKALLAKLDAGELTLAELDARADELLAAAVAALDAS